jgi:hypothetical protein
MTSVEKLHGVRDPVDIVFTGCLDVAKISEFELFSECRVQLVAVLDVEFLVGNQEE